jgi:coniferyl-aldehyde dehydrogenase
MDLQLHFSQLQELYRLNPNPSAEERRELLKTLKKGLQENAYQLIDAINKDFTHRAQEESLFLEIFPTIKASKYCFRHVEQWMKRRRRNASLLLFPALVYLKPQPLGIVGIMVPWNYPVYLALVPALYALAAGNRVMIKMSELSTHTGLALESLIYSLGLNKHIVIVNGDVDVAKVFASLPFGHILFTGSTQVGKLVMKSASENLTPVTLELGGKSPAVLSTSMNPKYFNRLLMGKLFNAAQTCIAPDYLLVPSGWEEIIEAEFHRFIHFHYPELTKNDHYSSIISSQHKARLLALIDEAKLKGARVVEFGDMLENSNKLPVYLLFNVTSDMKVMQEEIFGPILPVLTYKTFNDAIEYINSKPNPLALYYFGEDKSEKDIIQSNTLSGALTINDTIMHVAVDDLPFGGVGFSGMGYYHGQEGFDTFSRLKPVMVQRRLSPMTWLYPPYGKFLRFVLSWIGGIKLRDKHQ